MTLTEFLLARIAEDEEAAGRVLLDFGGGDLESLEARVLAECEAKRRIVEWCSAPTASEWHELPVLAMLALPYADHPDYDEAWRV